MKLFIMNRASASIVCVLLLGGCEHAAEVNQNSGTAPASTPPADIADTDSNPLRSAYFGDLHVHTSNSLDAYNVGVRATPDDAYRYARGEALNTPARLFGAAAWWTARLLRGDRSCRKHRHRASHGRSRKPALGTPVGKAVSTAAIPGRDGRQGPRSPHRN